MIMLWFLNAAIILPGILLHPRETILVVHPGAPHVGALIPGTGSKPNETGGFVMSKALWLAVVSLLCSVAFFLPAAWGTPTSFQVACEGIESGGGGTTKYQYTLKNTDIVNQTLTLFYLGTMDVNAGSYSNWVAPGGMTPAVGTWVALGNIANLSVMSTTMVKTPHGVMPPQQAFATPGGILWWGSIVVGPGQTVTFGFDHPSTSMDMEWFAEHPDPVNSSQGMLGSVIAGPLGVFNNGYVHGPGTEPTSVAETSWGGVKLLFR